MRARWDPTDILLGMGAIMHTGHKSLSWLNAADKQTIIDQLRNEMFAISNDADTSGASAEITVEPEATEPPAKRRAEADEDFNVYYLVGQIILKYLNMKWFMLLVIT